MTRSRRRFVRSIGSIAFVGLAGCLSETDQEAQNEDNVDDNGETSNGNATEGTGVGEQAPDFELETTDGDSIALYPVERPTVLIFIASSCPSCRDQSRNLREVYDQFGDNFRPISIDIDPHLSSTEDLRDFQEQYGGDWPHAMATAEFLETYHASATDTTYVLDIDGTITYTDESVTSVGTLEDQLTQIIDEET